MKKVVVKKISSSTYIKFSALFGASTGVLLAVMAFLMIPVILMDTPKEELLTTLPPLSIFLFAPIMGALAFGIYGVITYPFYLLICKIFKKFTLEIEFQPVETPPQPMDMTNIQYTPTENNNDTNQGVK